MSEQEAHDGTQGAEIRCDNCETTLRGEYCHVCGQSVHSPTRHFAHALEEVLESFWHLDGRLFRTLRDLIHPGRVAINYLAGKRARYIAPLRLFVILSLLTFFIGRLTVHVEESPFQLDGREAQIAAAQTIPEVEKTRDRLLAELSVAEKEAAKVPGVNASLVAARARIQGEAASRIAELREEEKARGQKPAANATTDAADARSQTQRGAEAREGKAQKGKTDAGDTIRFNDKPWDAKTNPVKIGWLPEFANRWLNKKIGRAQENIEHMDGHEEEFVTAFLSAVPTALFFLIPVFALLLKLMYVGSGRLYLEHLVVALYSHAWLLLVLLGMFVLNAVGDSVAARWVGIVTGFGTAALWLWMPVYLFLMQKRIYGEHWAITTIKYFLIGTVYLVLVTFAALFALLAGIVS